MPATRTGPMDGLVQFSFQTLVWVQLCSAITRGLPSRTDGTRHCRRSPLPSPRPPLVHTHPLPFRRHHFSLLSLALLLLNRSAKGTLYFDCAVYTWREHSATSPYFIGQWVKHSTGAGRRNSGRCRQTQAGQRRHRTCGKSADSTRNLCKPGPFTPQQKKN